MDSPSALYPKTVDLNNCDKEPIHLLGKIQSHGMLLVLDNKTDHLARASENIFNYFNLEKEQLHSYTLLDILGAQEGERLQIYLNSRGTQPFEIFINNQSYVAIIHTTTDLTYVELEQVSEMSDAQITQYHLSEIISKLSDASSVASMCEQTPILIKKLLGYDRVMLYQFDENWNGKVIAEAREEALDSWLGMHYPATDIPQQARALFLKQGVRIIADVASTPVEVFPQLNKDHTPLDLSRCELRAVSPIHIEYLTNMEVDATLTAAIVSNGTLWGLIACHHYTPKFVSYYQRSSIKFLTQVFSTQITLRVSNEVLKQINETAVKQSLLVNQMSEGEKIHQALTAQSHTMLDMTEAPGGAVFIDNHLAAIGDTPEEQDILHLIDWIYDHKKGDIYSTQHLAKEYERGAAFAKAASGVLCIFISTTTKDCLLWFKPELKQEISWGGNPEKAMKYQGQKISPRTSFARWNQEQRYTSLSWRDYEIASAKALRNTIANIIIKKYTEVKMLNDKLKMAYKELETFSYSVSHDLRAPLRGIDGFAQIIKEDYFDALDDYGKSSIQRIIDASEKMNMLIDDILSFSMVGKEGISSEIFDINKLIKKSLQFLQVDLVYPDTSITVEENLSLAYGDKGLMFQLLNNIIGNALKYSKNANKPTINIGQLKNSTPSIYYIKDNGIGFNDAYADRIFGIFDRLVKDKEYEGSGIGLAIVKRIIDRHGGRIWAESEVGKGASFYFKLPLKQ